MAPTSLETAQFFILKQRDGFLEPISARDKIGVEDANEFPGRTVKSVVKSSSFISLAICTVYPFDINTLLLILPDQLADQVNGIICRIIQHLDLKLVSWIIQVCHSP